MQEFADLTKNIAYNVVNNIGLPDLRIGSVKYINYSTIYYDSSKKIERISEIKVRLNNVNVELTEYNLSFTTELDIVTLYFDHDHKIFATKTEFQGNHNHDILESRTGFSGSPFRLKDKIRVNELVYLLSSKGNEKFLLLGVKGDKIV